MFSLGLIFYEMLCGGFKDIAEKKQSFNDLVYENNLSKKFN